MDVKFEDEVESEEFSNACETFLWYDANILNEFFMVGFFFALQCVRVVAFGDNVQLNASSSTV